jgi:hypothetical protein
MIQKTLVISEYKMMVQQNVLVLGGSSGCVSNIAVDFLTSSKEYTCLAAGRSPFVASGGITPTFYQYDVFEEGGTQCLIDTLKKNHGTIYAIINCISTGSKVSYDTTMIAQLNYVSLCAVIHIASIFQAKLIQMSSLKVGSPESNDPFQLEGKPNWLGARSPYAWSKLAAELKLMNSNLENYSLLRIGLMDSPHGQKFYTRVRAVCDFKVTVTTEEDLHESFCEALINDGKRVCNVLSHSENNVSFYKRMSNRWCLLHMPVSLFNFIVGRCMPTKMIDYVDSSFDFSYVIPM